MDEEAVLAEVRLCSECRLCEELSRYSCRVFPILYALNDAVASGKAVPYERFVNEAFSLCHYCKMCACEELPWAMWTARSQHFEKNGLPLENRVLSNVDTMSRLACRAPSLTNTLLSNNAFRNILSSVFKISNKRIIPQFQTPSVIETLSNPQPKHAGPPSNSSLKVAYFVGCSTNYNYTDIGLQTASILRRNGVHVVCPPQVCCGMPMLAEGNKEALITRVEENLDTLTKFIDDGYEIVTACPTCALMLKELIRNERFFGSEIAGKAKPVAANTRELGEYLAGLRRRNLLNVDFQKIPRTVAYYPPCHLKIQANGGAFFELMKLIPELRIVDIRGDYCCGMGGTLGLREKRYDASMRIGRRLFEKILSIPADVVVTECNGCRMQIFQGTRRKVIHPVEILGEAYGCDARSLRL